MLETMIQEEDPLNIITEVSEKLNKYELKVPPCQLGTFYERSEFLVRDYIIYNAHRITQEMPIKAIVSYTENGYTAARLSSLNPLVPIITFTKSDETYRFLNTLR